MSDIEKTLVEELISPELDDILSIRENLGADLAHVRLVERTWSGAGKGDGIYNDCVEEMHPAPGFKMIKQNYRTDSGGAYRQGDYLLTMISKNKYPEKSLIDCSSSSKKVEKFYEVNGELFTVIDVEEKYVYWNVHVRRHTDQSRKVKE